VRNSPSAEGIGRPTTSASELPTSENASAGAAWAVEVADLSRAFGERRALHHVSFAVASGERVALIGPSGSGKSTLLRLIAGLLTADRGSGALTIHGRVLQTGGRLSRDARRIRTGIGFVFQQFNLVGRLSVLKNVLVGRLARVPLWRSLPQVFTRAEQRDAMAALARVGLADRASQRASTLSGGQMQRVAIARAMCQQARVVLADEPIASLDPESARTVMRLLADLTRTEGATLLVSLHQIDVALRYCDRVIALRDGRIRFDGPNAALTSEVLRSIYGSGWAELLHEGPEPAAPSSALAIEEPASFSK
jgi:phosphonate transport system ATP-binding protein